jgi:hypothetical protein
MIKGVCGIDVEIIFHTHVRLFILVENEKAA